MKTPDPGKLEKLELALRKMVTILTRNRELAIHQTIDQFYYMQKSEEVRVLREHLLTTNPLPMHLADSMCIYHKQIFYRWRKDVRWLNRNLYKSPVEIEIEN